MAKISLSKKVELRQDSRCPECFRYLGKLETFSWLSIGYTPVKSSEPYCSNCLVSYPDNLKAEVA